MGVSGVIEREKSQHLVMTIIIPSVGDGADEERWLEEGQEETSEEWQHLCESCRSQAGQSY